MAFRIVSTMICLGECTVCISGSREIYSFGFHSKGAHGHDTNIVGPQKISSLQNITFIDCGIDHTICMDYNGTVFILGSTLQGMKSKRKYLFSKTQKQLKNSSTPQKVKIPQIAKQISCSNNSTVIFSEDGNLYSFGTDNFPNIINTILNIDFIECGGYHLICKTIDNEIYVLGENANGQLGTGDFTSHSTPYKCNNWPDSIVDIKCGCFHTLVLTSNQEVFSCGRNYSGEIGRDTDREHSASFKKLDIFEITRIACGGCHSMLLDANNDIYMFGSNLHGELGIGYTDGDDYRPMIHPSLSNIIDVSHGGSSTFVKTSNNEIYAFGNNTRSQLGFYKKSGIQFMPKHVFQGSENIWYTNLNKKSNQKSARSFK